ncbi:MAG: tetratricopeptide repeat protein [Methylohalobius sp.]|nr:tetratricopeptide repeat protein [Methylohalobius sp.]
MQNAKADDYGVKADEARLLPAYCKPIIPANLQHLARGSYHAPPGFFHGQHFCHGLKFMIRAQRAIGDKKLRDYRLQQAVGEFSYVVNANEGSPVYLAYTRIQRAKAYEMGGKLDLALRDLADAVRIAPKFPLAYGKLSDLYLKLGKTEEAKSVLQAGLKRNPNAKLLKQRLIKLR